MTTLTPDISKMGASPLSGDMPSFPRTIGTFMGRDALALAIAHLGLNANDTVVLPIYTCQEVVKLFLGRCRVVFYDIAADFTVDPNLIRTIVRDSTVRMVLIINYFGFLQPYRQALKQLCEERGICLIEDCAHSLLTEGSGSTGDLSIYSFRKILPVPDGGGLRVNNTSNSNNDCWPTPRFYPKAYSDALSVAAIIKSMLNIHTEKLSRGQVAAQTMQLLPPATEDSRVLPLSSTAQHRIAGISFPEIITKRRSDFRYWQEVVSSDSSLVPLFEDLPRGVCPLGFPVKIRHREQFEARARKKGIHLRVHWRLDPTLGTECSTSHELAKNIVTLPLYPELREKDREVLVGLIIRG